MLSLNISDMIGSTFTHVVNGYLGAVAGCLFIALARAVAMGSFTSTYRKSRQMR